MLNLSRFAARALMLAAQGLAHPPSLATTKADVVATIRRMAILQIDTIHVVARSPYFVLWSRLGDYEPRWLDELLAEGAIFSIGRTKPAFCQANITRCTAACNLKRKGEFGNSFIRGLKKTVPKLNG